METAVGKLVPGLWQILADTFSACSLFPFECHAAACISPDLAFNRKDSNEQRGPQDLVRTFTLLAMHGPMLTEQQKVFAPVHLDGIHWGLFVATAIKVTSA